MLTDTHAHLYLSEFSADRNEIIARAVTAGVSRIFLPNVDGGTVEDMLSLSRQFPDHCFPMIGLHPCSVNDHYTSELAVIRKYLDAGDRYYGIGETGLDFYRDKSRTQQQEDSFRTQIRWAKETGLPVVIHSRDSFDRTISIVEEMHDDKLRGVFHCFTGSPDDAARVAKLTGFYVGIGGVATFKNSGLDITLGTVPLSLVVLETDSPYLAPAPHRGKRNESAYIRLIAEKLASVYSVTVDEIAAVTTANAGYLFGF